MSEHQYYEFRAIDRLLDARDRSALRDISSRATITSTGFVNTYNWGDLRGKPFAMMEKWFDLHLYTSNWGTRVFMVRLPLRLIDQPRLEAMLERVTDAALDPAGDNMILTISRDEIEADYWDEDDSVWLDSMAPLREAMLAGDLRLAYLAWLMAVEIEDVDADALEPLSGLGPMTDALATFAEFFNIDGDLVAAAAEIDGPAATEVSADAARRTIEGLPAAFKDDLLIRLVDGDMSVINDVKVAIRAAAMAPPSAGPGGTRTVAMLRARAEAIANARREIAEATAAAERKRKEEEARQAQRERIDRLMRRGEKVWADVEEQIKRRNPAGYDAAIALLLDLAAMAREQDSMADFADRVRQIAERHDSKRRFIERLRDAGVR